MLVDVVQMFEGRIQPPSIVEIPEDRDRFGFVPATSVGFEVQDGSSGRRISSSIPVGAEAGHRIEPVDHREPAGGQWDLFAGEPIGIPASINSFVMTSNHIENQRLADLHPPKPLVSRHGVLLNDPELLGIESAGLAEDVSGDIDLAQIVENRAKHEVHQPRRIEPGCLRYGLGVHGDPPGVSRSAAVLQLDDSTKSIGEFKIHPLSLAPRVPPR